MCHECKDESTHTILAPKETTAHKRKKHLQQVTGMMETKEIAFLNKFFFFWREEYPIKGYTKKMTRNKYQEMKMHVFAARVGTRIQGIPVRGKNLN